MTASQSVLGLCLLTVLVCLPMVNCCGMTTHQVIAHRAMTYFFNSTVYPDYRDLILAHKGAVEVGSTAPDMLYACGTNHDNGEYFHWPPFQAYAAQYIRSQYPQPFNWNRHPEGAKLMAFMIGVNAHYIADVNWHGLEAMPPGYGMIEQIGGMDFNCTGQLAGGMTCLQGVSGDVAHSEADTGGEFLAAYQTDLNYIDVEAWYFPIKDVVAIFKLAGREVNGTSIDKCMVIFGVATEAVKHLAELVMPRETDSSPYFQENYVELALGGIDDMAVWSSRMYERFIHWVETGPPSPVPPLFEKPHSKLFQLAYALAKPLYESNPQLVSSEAMFEGRGVTISKHKDIKKLMHQALLHEVMEVGAGSEVVEALLGYLNYVLPKRTHNLSTVKSMLLGEVERARQVALEQHLLQDNIGSTLKIASLQASATSLEYFGRSLATGDLNGDGHFDTVVGAPGHGHSGLPQAGAVYIQYGRPVAGKSSTPAVVLTSQLVFGRFGEAVAILDFNKDGVLDIAVGAPSEGWDWTAITEGPIYNYHGAVYVYFGSKAGQPFVSDQSADVVIRSSLDRNFFGSVLTTGDCDGDGVADLVIGSPLADSATTGSTTTVSTGQVSIFLSSLSRETGHVYASTDADGELRLGGNVYAQFGYSLQVISDITPPLLVVGEPGYRCLHCDVGGVPMAVGRVQAFIIGSLAALKTPVRQFSLYGNTWKGKFGQAIAYGKPKKDSGAGGVLAISAPTIASYNVSSTFNYGVVIYVYPSTLKGELSVNDIVPVLTLESSKKNSRFGMTLHFGDMDGDGGEELIVGSPLTDTLDGLGIRETGALYVYRAGLTGENAKAESLADWNLETGSKFGRFSTALAHANQTIISGAPRAVLLGDNKTEMSGAVYYLQI